MLKKVLAVNNKRAYFWKSVKNYQGQTTFWENAIRKYLHFPKTFFLGVKFYCDYDLNLCQHLDSKLLPMRDLVSPCFLIRHTFVCGTFFGKFHFWKKRGIPDFTIFQKNCTGALVGASLFLYWPSPQPLNELYSPKKSSTYRSAILPDLQRSQVAEFALAQWYSIKWRPRSARGAAAQRARPTCILLRY